MPNFRTEIMAWIDAGNIEQENAVTALRLVGVLPDASKWRAFLATLCLWLGTSSSAAALIFFEAYNWQDMPHISKLIHIEAAIVLSLAMFVREQAGSRIATAALFMAIAATGALLALVGQIYQTGADTYELFSAWAAIALFWVVIGRSAVLWIVWLVIANLGLFFFVGTVFASVPGGTNSPEVVAVFVFNALALIAFQYVASRNRSNTDTRWPVRAVSVASAATATLMLAVGMLGFGGRGDLESLLAYAIWLALLLVFYRRVVIDVFILAVGILCTIVWVLTLLWKLLQPNLSFGLFLLAALIILGVAAAAGKWLKLVAMEQPR